MKPWVIPEDVLTGCETSSLDLVTQCLNVPHQQQQSVPQRLKSAPGCVVTNSTFSYSLPILPCSQFNGTRLWRCRITGALFQVLCIIARLCFQYGRHARGIQEILTVFFLPPEVSSTSPPLHTVWKSIASSWVTWWFAKINLRPTESLAPCPSQTPPTPELFLLTLPELCSALPAGNRELPPESHRLTKPDRLRHYLHDRHQ